MNCIQLAVLQDHMQMEPLAYNEVHTRPSLEERLESIISGAALMADSSCTRDERRERIVAECNAVRQALQDLLSEYMSNVSLLFLDTISLLRKYDCGMRVQSRSWETQNSEGRINYTLTFLSRSPKNCS